MFDAEKSLLVSYTPTFAKEPIFRYGPAATNKSRRRKANRASAGGTYCLQPLGPLFFYQIFFDPDMQLMQLSERNR